jgi:hypothetical protein
MQIFEEDVYRRQIIASSVIAIKRQSEMAREIFFESRAIAF